MALSPLYYSSWDNFISVVTEAELCRKRYEFKTIQLCCKLIKTTSLVLAVEYSVLYFVVYKRSFTEKAEYVNNSRRIRRLFFFLKEDTIRCQNCSLLISTKPNV